MYNRVYMYIHTDTCIHIHTYVYVHIDLRADCNRCIYDEMHNLVSLCVCSYIHIYIYMCIHICIRAYIYTHSTITEPGGRARHCASRTHQHTYTRTYITHMRTYIHPHPHTYIHRCTHTYIRTHPTVTTEPGRRARHRASRTHQARLSQG